MSQSKGEEVKHKRQTEEATSDYLATELAALAALLASERHHDDALHDDELDQATGGTNPTQPTYKEHRP